MKITLVVLLALLLTLPTYCQLPEDDEIDSTIPNYPHRIYSGITFHYLL